MAERGGFSPTTQNKPLTSIDPDFSIKNGSILAPKCNHECNQAGATIARNLQFTKRDVCSMRRKERMDSVSI
jgi:hypothetical protein